MSKTNMNVLVLFTAPAVVLLCTACPTRTHQQKTAGGRCELILSTVESDSGSIGGEASLKGVEVGKGKINAEQMQSFQVQLDELQADYNNISHDLCIDWANGALSNEQYNEAKKCLRNTHKKQRILLLGLQSGTVDGNMFMAKLEQITGEMDACESGAKSVASTTTQAAAGGCTSDSQCTPPKYCILGSCRPLGSSGETCAFDYDCVAPLVCSGGICGQAVRSTVVGAACSNDSHCQAPLFCILGGCRYLGNSGDGCAFDYDCNAPLVCQSGKCAVTGSAASTSTAYGTPCQSDTQCTAPLFCILGTCRYLGNPGDACAYDYDCYSPYKCTGGKCSVSASAGAGASGSDDLKAPAIFGTKSSVQGSLCTSDSDCQSPLFCILGICRPISKVGDVCGVNQDCVSGSTCIGGKCVQSAYGAACSTDADCAKPNYCILGYCRPISNEGGPCGQNQDCLAGMICSGGKCVKSKTGTACKSHADCSSPDYCIVGFCRPLSSVGGVCATAADCQAGLKCAGGFCAK
jgi:hypothetical protein